MSQPVRSNRRARRRLKTNHRAHFGAFTESAIGGTERFYVHLLGVRVGLRLNRRLMLSGAFSYVNLPGRNGRVSNVLPWLQLENRWQLGERWAMPLKFAVGYLPSNGPVVRFSLGFQYQINDLFLLRLDVLAPTLWRRSGEEDLLTWNLAAETAVGL